MGWVRGRLVHAALAAVLTGALVSGCGDRDGSAAPDDPSSSSDPTQSTKSPTDSPSAADSPSESPSSTVDPATGPAFDNEAYSIRLPKGFRFGGGTPSIRNYVGPDGEIITLEAYPGMPETSLDEAVKSYFRTTSVEIKPKERPTREVGGVEMYHLAGKIDRYQYIDQFGVVRDGFLVSIEVATQAAATTRAEHDEMVESVLATLEWK